MASTTIDRDVSTFRPSGPRSAFSSATSAWDGAALPFTIDLTAPAIPAQVAPALSSNAGMALATPLAGTALSVQILVAANAPAPDGEAPEPGVAEPGAIDAADAARLTVMGSGQARAPSPTPLPTAVPPAEVSTPQPGMPPAVPQGVQTGRQAPLADMQAPLADMAASRAGTRTSPTNPDAALSAAQADGEDTDAEAREAALAEGLLGEGLPTPVVLAPPMIAPQPTTPMPESGLGTRPASEAASAAVVTQPVSTERTATEGAGPPDRDAVPATPVATSPPDEGAATFGAVLGEASSPAFSGAPLPEAVAPPVVAVPAPAAAFGAVVGQAAPILAASPSPALSGAPLPDAMAPSVVAVPTPTAPEADALASPVPSPATQASAGETAPAPAAVPRATSRPSSSETTPAGERPAGERETDFSAILGGGTDTPTLPGQAAAATVPPAPASAAASHGVPMPAQAPVPLGAVPMTIGLRALAGSNTFEIRLDPKDLGRIDVNLAIDRETGSVQASLVVDRPETLALLQRDAGSLQQALSQAGLDAPDGSISLSLRGDGGQESPSGSGGRSSDHQGSGAQGHPRREAPDVKIPAAAVPLRLFGAGRGLDIRI